MEKKVTFCFFCPLEKIDTILKYKPKQRRQSQKKVLEFVRSHKQELDSIKSYNNVIRKKTIGAKKFRIHIEMYEEYSKEFVFLKELLYFYDFRQLFGNIFYGLPYRLPDVQKNKDINHTSIIYKEKENGASIQHSKQIDPVSYLSKVLNKDMDIIYRVFDEFIEDLNSVVDSKIAVEDAKFNWKNMTIHNFPEIAKEEEAFKALLLDLKAAFPTLYQDKV